MAKWLIAAFGENALTVLAALSGLADVDAITLSLARLSRDTIAIVTAAKSIGIAVAVNTVVKAGMTFGLGQPRQARGGHRRKHRGHCDGLHCILHDVLSFERFFL